MIGHGIGGLSLAELLIILMPNFFWQYISVSQLHFSTNDHFFFLVDCISIVVQALSSLQIN